MALYLRRPKRDEERIGRGLLSGPRKAQSHVTKVDSKIQNMDWMEELFMIFRSFAQMCLLIGTLF